MSPRFAHAICAVAGLCVSLPVAGASPQDSPQFRARVDLIQLDVSAVDKNHQPVRGLTAADFTILENGKKQAIQAFVPIDLPEEPPRTPGWMLDVAPDVIANTGVDEDRLVVIVLDDYSVDITKDLWAQKSLKEIGHGIIDRLGPRDLAAVVYTVASKNNQEFTHDRERLLAAVDRYSPAAVPQFAAMLVLERVCEVLGSVTQRRKVVVLVSPGGLPPGSGNIISIAQHFNVNIFPIDPAGIRVGTVAPPAPVVDLGPTVPGRLGNPVGVPTLREDMERTNDIDRLNGLRASMYFLANATGGHFFQWNEFTKSLNQVFRETGSFYLLGYVSSNTVPDDKFRTLDIKVNRRGVTVRARTFNSPKPLLSRTPLATAPPPSLEALAGLVPVRGVPLSITAVPFATEAPYAAGATPAVAVALGLPAPADGADDLDVLIKAFTFDGVLKQTKSLRAHVDARASAVGPDSQVQIVDRLDLPPGRYQLRAGVTSARRQTSGSVYADLDVPDFMKQPLSLSGVALSDPRITRVVSAEATGRLLQVVPMTTRTFDKMAIVTSFVEVYQNPGLRVQPVALTVHIHDDREQVVFSQTDAIDAARFDALHRAPFSLVLPLRTLKPGEYLLTLEAKAGTATARRDVRFAVK
jgi:VWFA-related protein